LGFGIWDGGNGGNGPVFDMHLSRLGIATVGFVFIATGVSWEYDTSFFFHTVMIPDNPK
jgi:hypothetical protein